jgi:predicted ferric reductase
MRNIKLTFWGLVVLLSGLWLAADAVLFRPYEFFALRSSLINYTGILGIGVMSVAMILAVRPVFFEPFLGGLDKMYRLHKWLGISALLIAIMHWLWTQAPKWMVGLGWLARPERHHARGASEGLQQFLESQRGPAEAVGEWAFYAAVLLIVLALMKRFPYRYFFGTHRLLAIVYLLLVYHSLILMSFSYWSEGVAPVITGLMTAGSVAALGILFGTVGQGRRAVGVIEEITHHRDVRAVEVGILIRGRWSGHQPGQFAFVTFDAQEGPHPFTITSAWQGDGRMQFVIKALGDYTQSLPSALQVGDPVKIEGPYGQFNFRSNKPRQIWVAGGIGITPFIARMQQRARQSDGKIVDLFYCTMLADDAVIGRLRRDAQEARVTLHVLVKARDGLLKAQQICRAVPKWQSSDVWFCGPAAFGHDLRRDFRARGLAADDFHQELFDLR